MRKIQFGSAALWITLLVVSVVFAAFVLPVFPTGWQKILFRTVYSIIFIVSILSIEKLSNYLLILFFITLILEWVSGIFNIPTIYIVSRSVNVLFFLVIVVTLIKQIATAGEVTAGVIMGSIAGYLLLGIIYSIFISIIIQNDPGAYSAQTDVTPGDGLNTSIPMYFSYVTLASLGYGDIVPLKPYSRSLATFIAVSGQFYIAIIVALLVGKFSSQGNKK
jgi:voltage-gated potassium channel